MTREESMVPEGNCGYLEEGGICGAISQTNLRGNECGNETKNACCFTCGQRDTCSIGCDGCDTTHKEQQVPLSEEQLFKAGHSVEKTFARLVGILLIPVGLVLAPIFVDWIGPASRLFQLFPSWRTFYILVCCLFPTGLILGGIALVAYGSKKDREKPDISMMNSGS
jgi:hypothetical protein